MLKMIMGELMEKDDFQLIQQILAGDESAFGDLVQKHQKSVHAVAWREIGDFHFAEEITQDVFLQVYKKLPTLKDPNLFAGWLYVITKRQCIAWKRRKKQSIQSLETMSQQTLEESAYASYISEVREDAAVECRREIVQKLLEKLPEIERTVVILHYLGEMTCEAISKFLGVSPNTVKSRLSRARKRLRKEDTILRETLGSVSLSPNLTQNILRKIRNIEQAPPSGSKSLLPLGALGSSVVLIVFLLGMSNHFLNRYQLPYSLDAQSETTIEIVEVPIITEIKSISDEQNRVGNNTSPGNSSSNGLQKGNKEMQNNLQQDSTKWKLPDGAKARLGKGHIFDMAYSPDGKLLAAGGTIGIWLYDANTGKELNLFVEHMESSTTVAFSPDSQLLASDGSDSTILLWNPYTGEHKATLKGHQDSVNSVVFSPDGKTLASGSDDETIRLWHVESGALLRTFAGHGGGVSEVIYSPDGKVLISYGRDEMLHLWNSHTGEFLRTLTEHKGYSSGIVFSFDGKYFASGGEDGTIRLWELHTSHEDPTIEIEAASGLHGVHTIVFSPTDNILVSCNSGDDVIQFWEVETGKLLKTIDSPEDTTYHLALSPDGNTLANAGGNGTIQFWDVATSKSKLILNGYAEMFRDMAYSPDGSALVTVSSGPCLQLWDANTGKLKKAYYPGKINITCIAYAPDGVTLVCGPGPYEYDTVFLLNTETGEFGRIFQGDYEGFESIAFSADGKMLAGGDSSGNIYLWDVDTGETIKAIEWGQDFVRTVAFSPDGETLVSTNDSEICFWDINTGKAIKTIAATSIAISPEWDKFVCVNWIKGGTTQFWNMGDDEPVKIITLEAKTYFQEYSPDGKAIAGTGPRETISIWDADTYEMFHIITDEHKKSSRSERTFFVRYSPDGRTIATAGWDSTVLLWDAPR